VTWRRIASAPRATGLPVARRRGVSWPVRQEYGPSTEARQRTRRIARTGRQPAI